MRRALLTALITLGAIIAPAYAETLYCTTSFQGYRTCSTAGNTYKSFEWDNNGYHYGDDNRGNKWTTFKGGGGEITIHQTHGQ
jgi:hypothetical protein